MVCGLEMKKDKPIPKAVALYYYPKYSREILVLGVFEKEEDIENDQPMYYTIWDDNGRLDKYDFEEWESLPTREEIKAHYLDLL